MAKMGHRERVMRALNHEEPDRVPLDWGTTTATGISLVAYENLRRYLGLDSRKSEAMFFWHQLARIDEDVLERFDIDTRPVITGSPDRWRDVFYPDGSFEDEWGVVRRKAEGGHHYDVCKSPLSGDITMKDLDRVRWPDPHDPGRMRGVGERAKWLRENTDYAIVAYFPIYIVTHSQLMRGFEGWFSDLILNPGLSKALMGKVLEIGVEIAKDLFRTLGLNVDVVYVSDDIAMQNGPMISLEMYREYIKPLQAKLFNAIRSYTNAKILYHCCGSVYALLPDFVDLGIDAINPVQVSAADMGDTKRLKEKFGGKISFWGGIDIHKVLPFGTPEEVELEVKHRVADLAPGGGYILTPAHSVQPEVPPQNVVAMFEAAHTWGVYPISV